MHLRTRILVAYLCSLPLYMVLDALWIGGFAKEFYFENIGHLFSATVQWPVVIVFYLLFGVGLSLFAVAPALRKNELRYAGVYGALFGFFTYMTYDLTNWATLLGWTASVSYVDIAWGTCASAIVAMGSYLLSKTLIR